MKAYVLNEIGKLDLMDVPRPELSENEVLVEVMAAGICGSDIPRIYETGTYHFPTIPGHEFSGVVREVRSKENQYLIGKRVGIFPLIPCMKCSSCRNRKYEMCMHYDYLGSRRDGGFAEFVAVPARNVMILPDEISFETAAMLEPTCVGIHALQQIALKNVTSALVIGAGTIGILMAQWLRALQVQNIYIVGTGESQKRLCSKLGLDHYFVNRENELDQNIFEQTNGEGCDLTIECTGYADVLKECIRFAKRGGTVCVVGNPHTDMELSKDIYWQILRKQLRINGTWNSSFIPEDTTDDWRMSMEAIVDGKLHPEMQITHRLPFDKLQDGLQLMRDKKEFFNKVMIIK